MDKSKESGAGAVAYSSAGGLVKGLVVQRRFTTKGVDPFSIFEYEMRSSIIKNPDGSVVHEIKDVEVPKFWSQVATDILAQKYFRKAGVPQYDKNNNPIFDANGTPVLGSEKSAKQVINRMVKCWRHWGEKYGYFASEDDAQAFEDELKYMVMNQMAAPNSPQWFNTGLALSYDIIGSPQGHWFVDPETGVLTPSPDAYTHAQAHACFIQSVNDDLVNEGGIFDLVTREARVFKYGSGTGSNFSSLRGKGEKLSGGGSSSGLMSFLKIFDRAAGAIKSGGTTRRAAKMVILDVDHPEIEDFVTWKANEEQKVADLYTGSRINSKYLNQIMRVAQEQNTTDWKANKELRRAIVSALERNVPFTYIIRALTLADQGKTEINFPVYDTHYEGEAYLTVSGQNSNNSIRIPNSFMDAVQANANWNLKGRTGNVITKTLPARELWDKIAFAAWASADPGLQFDDHINEWHTCPADGKIYGTNPCSEYIFLNDTACNLASINLLKFLDEKTAKFDVDLFRHATRLWTVVLEISVLMAQFPSKEIAQRSYEFRTLGLGYANLGTSLMVLGIPYDSEEGRAIGGALTSIMCGQSYATSAEMAGLFGPFPNYTRNSDNMLRVIRNHRRAAHNSPSEEYEGLTIKPLAINSKHCPAYLLSSARECWDQALSDGEKNGYRNAQVTVIAPTGCLLGNSLVSTDLGLVRLRNLGDVKGHQWQDVSFNVMTDQGQKQATQFYINGLAETRKIKTSAGYNIQGTSKHKIKVVNSQGNFVWKTFTEIIKGDIIPLAMNSIFGEPRQVLLPTLPEMHWTADFETRVPKEMDAKLAELAGYFMGDGSLHSKGLRFCVTNGDEDVVKHLETSIKELFNLDCHVTPQEGYLEVAVNSVALALWWDAAGFSKLKPENHIGGKGYQPYIPDAILHTNDSEIYAAFLRGLFEADGTVTQGNPSWSTADDDFSQEVKSLLLALGYPTTTKIDISGWGQSEIYATRTRNASYNQSFMQNIGFISKRKTSQVVISDTTQAGKKDRIYLPSEVMGEVVASSGSHKNAIQLSLKRHNAVSRQSAQAIAEQTKSTGLQQGLRHALQFFYDAVESNEDGGVEPTYDLSVPENVTYVANGFISHNTIGLVMDCDTTGVEPDFAIVKFKKLAGGGYFKIVNQSVKKALKRLGYGDEQIREIEEYSKGHGTLVGCPHINSDSLKAKGFTEEKLKTIESQLLNAFDLKFVFNKYTLGEDFCVKTLGFSKEVLADPKFDMLSAMGYTADQINKANDYVCGTMTIEGAPHLKEEHYPVFDCANKCGKYGKRHIPHMAHVKMMAAVQPFISGGISKTINMPNEATLEDVKEVYAQSYNLMVKCVALYRDGSKLSQPLNSQADDVNELLSLVGSENDVDETVGPQQVQQVLVRGMRKKLPPKRSGFVQEARIGGQKLFVRTGEYPDGELGEVFIDSYKEGAGYRSLLNCFAIAVSKGLQYGVPLEEFVDTFTFTRFEPSGVVSGHPNVKQATSLVDFVFRILGYEYLGRSDLVHVPDDSLNNGNVITPTIKPLIPNPPENKVPAVVPKQQKSKLDGKDSNVDKRVDAKLQGFTGEQCGNCGGMRVKNNGSCTVCVDCGQTTGCS